MTDWVRKEYEKALREAEQQSQEVKKLEERVQTQKNILATQGKDPRDAEEAAKKDLEEAREKEKKKKEKAAMIKKRIEGEGNERERDMEAIKALHDRNQGR